MPVTASIRISEINREKIYTIKGPSRTYDDVISELLKEYEHRSPPASNETGYPITGQ